MARRRLTFLLDTHALLWAIGDPDRLGHRARGAISDATNELVVSAASAWEIATKHRLGKLPSARPIISGYSSYITRLGGREVSMSSRDALLAGDLDWAHRDPFDRILAAQALSEGWVLITADAAFGTLPGLRTLW